MTNGLFLAASIRQVFLALTGRTIVMPSALLWITQRPCCRPPLLSRSSQIMYLQVLGEIGRHNPDPCLANKRCEQLEGAASFQEFCDLLI